MDMDMHTDMDMQHGHGHAAWAWTCSMDMDMQHGHENAAWTWTCSMDMHMQHVHGMACFNRFMKTFSHVCCPSRVQVADDGRPGLLLHVYFKQYMKADVFTPRTIQK
jgi:hypothetical protein